MDIIVTAASPDINGNIDSRFGRGAYFLQVDTTTMETQAYPNEAASASGGAGTKAAQFVASKQVGAVISGDFGPNALRALKAAGIPMYLLGNTRTARDAVLRFNKGELEQV